MQGKSLKSLERTLETDKMTTISVEEYKKKSDYRCGKYKYLETLYFVRQYNDQKKLLEEIEEDMTSLSSPAITGMPTAPVKVDNPNENNLINKIMMKEQLEKNIQIIETALSALPEEYREPILAHTLREATYLHPAFDAAHENTWKKWQQRFIFIVATLRGDGPYIDLIQRYILSKEKNTRG